MTIKSSFHDPKMTRGKVTDSDMRKGSCYRIYAQHEIFTGPCRAPAGFLPRPVEDVHVEVEIFDRFNLGIVEEFDSIFTGEGKRLRLKGVSVTSARK